MGRYRHVTQSRLASTDAVHLSGPPLSGVEVLKYKIGACAWGSYSAETTMLLI